MPCGLALLAWWIRAACHRAFTASAAQFDRAQRPAGRTVRYVRERRQPSPRPRPQSNASASAVLAVFLVEQDNPDLNLICISAAWSKLAALRDATNSHSFFPAFVSLTQSFLSKPAGYAREVTGIFWAAAKLQDRMSLQPASLWTSLASAVKSIVNQMDAQGVSNVIYAIETLPTNSVASKAVLGLLPLLARRVSGVISKMVEQAVTNVVWSTGQLLDDPARASMSQDLRKVLPVAVARFRVVLQSATPRELANICWGLALSDYHDAAFYEAVAAKVANEASEWRQAGAQLDLPALVCAFARVKATGHQKLLDAVSKKMSPALTDVNNWGICAMTWSYKQLDTGDDFLPFRQTLAAEVARRGLSQEDLERSRLGPEKWRKGT